VLDESKKMFESLKSCGWLADAAMRTLALLSILASIGMPAIASSDVELDPVSVQQLEKLLKTVHGMPDAKLATQLYAISLTERLSTARLTRLGAELQSPKARQALVALADASAFLTPPADEIPANAKPDLAAQRQIISLATAFVVRTMHRLPDFIAARDTTEFQNNLKGHASASPIAAAEARFHFVGSTSATVVYRDGSEVVDEKQETKPGKKQLTNGLNAVGEFGPLLDIVFNDITHAKMEWSHWEQGAAGTMAVFHFSVSKEKSHYEVKHCCVWFPNNAAQLGELPGMFDEFPGYHGEIAIDPANGDILRLAVQPELQPIFPIVRADVAVEYGLVDIGGKSYICPVKSVSISDATIERSSPFGSAAYLAGFKRTALNDVVFKQYRQFRGEVQILSVDTAEQHGNAQPSAPASAPPATPAKAPQP
jgi:hypothetical protein